MTIFGKHRVRATFYHMVSIVFLISTALWYYEILSDKGSFILTAVLFIVDYIAEMYDPHPISPGPWYAHFHRIVGDTEEIELCAITSASEDFVRNWNDKY